MATPPSTDLQSPDHRWDQGAYLSILTSAPAEEVKRFVDEWVLPTIESVDVLENRTGLVMIPARDTVAGAAFHLGEALVTEAKVLIEGRIGYAACLGRDREQAVAIALLDALIQTGQRHDLLAPMVATWERRQHAARDEEMRRVEATRVEMETF